MSRREVSIRFGVKGPTGLHSTTWKCWSPKGSGKYDVYLLNRAIGAALKASLHETGEWHLAYDTVFLDVETDENSRPQSRFLEKWDRPTQIGPGVTLAFRILVPSGGVNIPSSERLPMDIKWVPAPPPNMAAEIAVFITEPGTISTGWPGMESMGTGLLGRFTLDNKSTVWLVHHIVDVPKSEPVQAKMTLFKSGKAVDLEETNLRIIVMGRWVDGSRWMMESVVELSESALGKLKSLQSK